MVQETFYTITSNTEGIYKERGSKFISFAYPAESEEIVKQILIELRKKYHDARHHCYAFRIGTKDLYYRVNDDGEPSGTAGKQIYGQILSEKLSNILIVVVRYFGGTLLGTSGLIHAYRTSTADCLQKASLVEIRTEKILEIAFPYEQMNSVMQIIKKEQVTCMKQNIESVCTMVLKIQEGFYERIVHQLQLIKNLEMH